MSLLHASVLALGGLLVAVPIVLHLVMRQRPRQLVFPALRLVRARRAANRRTLQLRQWALLLLRCAVVGLLAAALARPRVASAAFASWLACGGLLLLGALVVWLAALAAVRRRGRWLVAGLGALALGLAAAAAVFARQAVVGGQQVLLGDHEAPVAAVLVVDNSPRMLYRLRNRTRLEEAREMASWLLGQLPRDSQIAIADLRSGARAFSADLPAAARTAAALETTNVPLSLPAVLQDALELVQSSDKPRKEVYVFTDLTRAAWDEPQAGTLARTLSQDAETLVYVIDVGVRQPVNFALGEPRLAGDVLPRNTPLELRADLTHTGGGGERAVQLYLEMPDSQRPVSVDGQLLLPARQLRARETRTLGPDGSASVAFTLSGLEVGTHHGVLQLAGEDGLPIDDQRYFTVAVQPAWSVLVVVSGSATPRFVVDALAPYEFRETGQARFQCHTIGLDQLLTHDLRPYQAVCLLDPAPLPAAAWDHLTEYARAGGGVALLLGRNAQPAASFNEPPAQQLLPGPLVRQWRAPEGLYLAPRRLEHPLLAAFRPVRTTIPWENFPVTRHWWIDPLAADAQTVIPFSNNRPALLERQVGQGRVLTLTTPLSDAANLPGRAPWNLLPTGPEPWPFVMLANELVLYLVQSGSERLNLLTGQPAQFRLPTGTAAGRYELFTPRGDWQEIAPSDGVLRVPFTENPGTYRLKSVRAADTARGFSANLPESFSQLQRLPPDGLDKVLGAGRFHAARSREEIDRGIGEARVGREFYPFLLLTLVVVLGLEHLLANRFYRPGEP